MTQTLLLAWHCICCNEPCFIQKKPQDWNIFEAFLIWIVHNQLYQQIKWCQRLFRDDLWYFHIWYIWKSSLFFGTVIFIVFSLYLYQVILRVITNKLDRIRQYLVARMFHWKVQVTSSWKHQEKMVLVAWFPSLSTIQKVCSKNRSWCCWKEDCHLWSADGWRPWPSLSWTNIAQKS